MLIVGIIVFALGILVSIALHEAGHMWSAKAFGMKVTRFFIGFGPTLFSFRRGVTEYGVKAIPAGAFVKIVGMTPQDDDVEPEDEKRAMWRYPVWKRTIVMSAGSMAHFLLGFLILWGVLAFFPHNDYKKTEALPAVVDTVLPCIRVEFKIENNQLVTCKEGTDPQSAAKALGLQSGDKILQVNGVDVPSWTAMTEKIRAAGGQTVTLTYERSGQVITSKPIILPSAERPRADLDPMTPASKITKADLERVGQLGITPTVVRETAGPIGGIVMAKDATGQVFVATFDAMKRFPEKIPKLWAAITGSERDPETPVSVVGASRIGGELFERGDLASFLVLLAGLNFFVGLFNLLPLLPLDGGHIAIAWFERVRSWLYARLRRPEPGRVDYMKLMPLTYAVIFVFGGITLLTLAADIINPITLPK